MTLLCMRPATAGDLNCNEEIAAVLQPPATGYWCEEIKHDKTGETVSSNIEGRVNCVLHNFLCAGTYYGHFLIS